MPLAIVETDTFPTTLQIPAAGELASAPGLASLYLQGAANRLRWLFNRVNKLVAGGAFTPSDNLTLDTPTGKTIAINGAVIDSAADGGDLRPTGAVQGRHRVAFVSCSSPGTISIPHYAEYVFPSGFGAPVASGVIWQVATPPSGSTDRCWVMTLINPQGAPGIIVKDAGGITIVTIATASGSARSCTIAYDGSAWKILNYVLIP